MYTDPAQAILQGETFLGIELGSTRIKSVLIGADYAPLASGVHEWESRLEDGVWTYGLDAVWAGVQDSYGQLVDDVRRRYGVPLAALGGAGVSGMMHGYLPFDRNGRLLTPFRTWRNTTTGRAAALLTEAFDFNIPQRWSVAHLYQAMLNREAHVGAVAFLTTLSGYVHGRLTGCRALGVGEASGVFPIDGGVNGYHAGMLRRFDGMAGGGFRLADALPPVLGAGENAGMLTEEGARLLDPTGRLAPGVPFCPPEGDAGTGMTATNSVAPLTGNVSAGTSAFAMVVLEQALSGVYPEIDMVTTPTGRPVAMVHCNSCTSDLDEWMALLGETLAVMGRRADKTELYETLFAKALEGDPDGGGLLSYNCYAGEPLLGLDAGRPLFTRAPNRRLTLANFMRAHLFSAMSALRLGMDILAGKERVRPAQLFGHGGLFKAGEAGQRLLAAALNVPVATTASAGEGGAWGIALLAAYARQRAGAETLEDFLARRVFAGQPVRRVEPDPGDVRGFNEYLRRYTAGLAVARAAAERLPD